MEKQNTKFNIEPMKRKCVKDVREGVQKKTRLLREHVPYQGGGGGQPPSPPKKKFPDKI